MSELRDRLDQAQRATAEALWTTRPCADAMRITDAHTPSRVTLTNAQGDSITIDDGDPLAPMSADEADRVQRFLAGCAGWTVDGVNPSD